MLKPFQLVPKILYEFIIFVVLTILVGHTGIIVSMFARSNDQFFIQFINEQMTNGVFFNLAIAFLVGRIFPIILEFSKNHSTHFKGIKMSTTAVALMLIIFCVAFLASPRQSVIKQNLVLQLVFYLGAILIAVYLFLLTYLDEFREDFRTLDDNRRNELAASAGTPQIDERGVKA